MTGDKDLLGAVDHDLLYGRIVQEGLDGSKAEDLIQDLVYNLPLFAPIRPRPELPEDLRHLLAEFPLQLLPLNGDKLREVQALDEDAVNLHLKLKGVPPLYLWRGLGGDGRSPFTARLF